MANESVVDTVAPPVGGEQPSGSEPSWEDLAVAGNDDDDDGDGTPPLEGEVIPAGEGVKPAPAAAPAPATVVATPAPTPPVQTPEQITAAANAADEERKRLRAEYMAKVEGGYNLPADVVAQFVTSPETVLPRLLAMAHANAVQEAIQQMQFMLPQQLTHHQNVTTVHQKAFGDFTTYWPEIAAVSADDKKMQVVTDAVVAYRKANPNATQEEVTKKGGLSALLMLGMPIPERVARELSGVVTVPAGRPSQPANPGGGGGAPVSVSDNQITLFAEELLHDES